MSQIGGLLKAGLSTLQQAWGKEILTIGGKPVPGVWNDSADSAQLQMGGFDAQEMATVLVAIRDLSAKALMAPARGSLIQARGRTWRVEEVRREADYAVTLTIVDPRSSR
jgi:hypothetical protein